MERLDPATEKGLKEGRARQPSSQQLLDDLTQGLYLMKVPLGHIVLPIGLGDGVATCEHEKRRVGVVPQKEPYFPPPIWRIGCRVVEVEISSMAGSNEDVHTAQSHHFHA
jgi:hypothetical protein